MEDVKVAILEQKLEDLKPIIVKIDAAIEKLSEVNTTVSRMLAVHEERISKQQEIDDILFAKIDKLSDKVDVNHDSVLSRVRLIETKVWIGMGCVAAITFLFSNYDFVGNLTQPQSTPIMVREK